MGIWETRTLGDTCEMYQPKTISGKEMITDGEYPVFGANGIIGRYYKFNHEEPQILITCRGATCGSVNISEPKSWITGNAMVVRPKSVAIDMRFLEYLFRGGIDISKAITGAAQPQITRTNLSPLQISYPIDVVEQKRIVAILDEAFAGIDAAVANTEKNLANGRELFKSYLNGVFTRKGEGWSHVQLSDICDVRDGTHDSPKYVAVGIPFVTQKNIRDDGLCFENIKFISDSDHKKFYKRSNVSEGDILISMIGVNRGMTCLVDDSRTFSIKNVGLIKASDKIDMSFLLCYLKSNLAESYVEAESRGGAQPFIGLKKLREFPVAVAPSSVQVSVVQQVEELLLQTQHLESIYLQKLIALAELKQTILQKAFAGELTTLPDQALAEAVA